MADIAASDVTYTLIEGTQQTNHNSRYDAVFSVAFGNGVLTYPANGIPLTKAKLGCPVSLEKFILLSPSPGDGYVYKYDSTNTSIRIYQTGSGVVAQQLSELLNAATPAATTIRAEAIGW